MSETITAPNGRPATACRGGGQHTSKSKDLSFEVPGAPQVYTQLRAQPQVKINPQTCASASRAGGPERL